MTIKIVGMIIGLLIFGGGIFYLTKEKHDPESRKIYSVVSIAGGVITVAAAVALML